MPLTTTSSGSTAQNPAQPYVAAWRSFLHPISHRWETGVTAVLLPVALLALASFLRAMESRPGALLADPLVAYFSPPRDVTWLTFLFIYAALVIALFVLLRHPRELLIAAQSYIIMIMIRIAAMYVTPLDPPAGLIPLHDPVVEYFGTGLVLTRDLFFSGHTATLFLLVLVTPGRIMKGLFLVCTIGVALCVIVQHVHYTVDVLVAPLASYTAFRLARLAPWH